MRQEKAQGLKRHYFRISGGKDKQRNMTASSGELDALCRVSSLTITVLASPENLTGCLQTHRFEPDKIRRMALHFRFFELPGCLGLWGYHSKNTLDLVFNEETISHGFGGWEPTDLLSMRTKALLFHICCPTCKDSISSGLSNLSQWKSDFLTSGVLAT